MFLADQDRLPARYHPPSTSSVIFLALLQRTEASAGTTAFIMLDFDLAALAPWLEIVAALKPAIFAFLKDFNRHNFICSSLARVAHYPAICYEDDFSDEYANETDEYPAKVILLVGTTSPATIRRLQRMRVPPICLASNLTTREQLQSVNIPSTLLADVQPETLNARIGKIFQIPPETLADLGYSQQQQRAFYELQAHAEAFTLIPSPLNPAVDSRQRFLRPLELLSSVQRGRAITAAPTIPCTREQAIEQAEPLLRSIFAQKLIDNSLTVRDYDNAPAAVAAAFREYREHRDEITYNALLAVAEPIAQTIPEACDYGICVPALNRIIPLERYRRTIPSRILKYFFKHRERDYIRYFDRADLRTPADEAQLRALCVSEALEYDYITAMLTQYGITGRIPILRTPQVASNLFSKLQHLYDLYVDRSYQLFTKRLMEFCALLAEEIPVPYRDILNTIRPSYLKAFSDLPIEWFPVEGVPLLFRTPVGRVPLAPGNGLFAHYQRSNDTLWLRLREADDILILNCLAPDDELHPFPKAFAALLAEDDIPHTYRTISGRNEYRDVIEEVQPVILIHWGHGSYDRREDRGYLLLGDERTEVWDLAGMYAPTIVLLAACDTAAMASTHNTVANGWLATGARAVLGTYFPVDAEHTLHLYARLLANLSHALAGDRGLPTWAHVVAKTLALQRYLDFLLPYHEWRRRRGLRPVPQEVIMEFTYRWNRSNLGLTQGYHACTRLLREALAHFGAEFGEGFDQFLVSVPVVPHTMFFTQLGSPETIRIHQEEDPSYEATSTSVAYWARRAAEETV